MLTHLTLENFFSRMVLPALDAAIVATIFSSPTRAFVQGPRDLSRLQHLADGRNRCALGQPRFSATAGPPVGAVGSQAAALSPVIRSRRRDPGVAVNVKVVVA